MAKKRVKLRIHPKTFCEEDLIVNLDSLSRDKLHLSLGDVVEISPCGENGQTPLPRLCLQVEEVPQEIQTKGGPLSVSREIAGAFGLEGVREVAVRRVDREDVGLDLIELRIKDQCLTRSDMWRVTSSLSDKFVHIGKMLEHAGVRVTVSRLWSSSGGVVTSGAILSRTRAVFRSASVQLFLYLQISTEMWDFDQSGDLYFDKAVGGFLRELFRQWQEEGCNHEVTLVFFWRVFYSQSALEELPEVVRGCVQKDKKGRSYEDFYKVIAAGESLSDWSSKLVDIKHTFVHLKESLVRARGTAAQISTAAEGNVLEAINMAMNVFQRHYMDCSFSMTGHQVVIVTAGAGMFEVDHELTRLTNERLVNGGIATDLVCLTEQPLHAVPLLKFQNVDSQDNTDYYHIPHWINYSFYSPAHSRNQFRFQPRLQLSDHLVNQHLMRGRRRYKGNRLFNPFTTVRSSDDSKKVLEDRLLNRVDYDEYDSAIFSLTPSQGVTQQTSKSGRPRSAKSARTRYHSTGESVPRQSPLMAAGGFEEDPFEGEELTGQSPSTRSSETLRVESKEALFTTSVEPGSYRARFHTDEKMDSSLTSGHAKLAVGSTESLHHFPKEPITHRNKSLINPFDPTQQADMTAYHRRWSHVFPRNKSGVAFQVHHEVPGQSGDQSHDIKRKSGDSPPQSSEGQGSLASGSGLWMKKTDSLQWHDNFYSSTSPQKNIEPDFKSTSEPRLTPGQPKGGGSADSSPLARRGNKVPSTENFALARRLGADWRSLTEPACLPVTTDFFPPYEKLTSEFLEYPSKLVASTYVYGGESTGEKTTPAWISDHQNIGTIQVFSEMISQRLSQGFQLVFEPRGGYKTEQDTIFSLQKSLSQLQEEVANGKKKRHRPRDISVKLSLGRLFQKMELNEPDLVIWIYRPKSREVTNQTSCTYQLSVTTPTLQGTDSQGVEFTTREAEFCHTRAEDYNWNYLDQHVCGYSDFEELGESQKYWRCRYLLLPSAGPQTGGGVAYTTTLVANFVRFLEFLNHIKRGSKPGSKQSSLQQGVLKRQNSLPIPTTPTNSRISTPSDAHSTLHSPLTTRLADIGEERLRPHSPSRSLSSPHHIRVSSPYLATSQPKSRRGGANAFTSISDLKPTTKKESDDRRARPLHRRTSSHDLDTMQRIEPKPKVRGSPQLLRRGGGDQTPSGSRQDLSFGSRTSSPSHTGRGKGAKRSTEGSLPVEVTPPTPSEEAGPSVASETISHDSSFYQVQLLNSSSPVQLLARAMASTEDGIDFLTALPGLKHSCFIAMEAVSWLVEKVSGVEGRKGAVEILQRMVSEQVVIHASGDFHIPFIDGYFLYQLPMRDNLNPTNAEQPKEKEVVDKSFVLVEPMDYEKFSKRWFEVKIHQPVTDLQEEDTLLTFRGSPSSMSPFPTSFRQSGAAYYMHFEGKESMEIPQAMLNRYVELNPDPQGRSDRPEWCYVRYDHAYRPNCAFQLEFQWMVSTMNLLHQLVQSWLYKATMCGFNLVPVPMLPSLTGSTHPFSQQHFIPLKFPASFVAWSCDASSFNKLFDAIVSKFCFLRDPASLPLSTDVFSHHYDNDTTKFFIHQSGVALVQPTFDLLDSNKGSPTAESTAVDIKGVGVKDQFSIPLGSSTPLRVSPNDEIYIPPGQRGDSLSGCGFHWYRNHLFLRQNNVASVQEQYTKLLSQLTEFCRDSEGELSELCNLLYSEDGDI